MKRSREMVFDEEVDHRNGVRIFKRCECGDCKIDGGWIKMVDFQPRPLGSLSKQKALARRKPASTTAALSPKELSDLIRQLKVLRACLVELLPPGMTLENSRCLDWEKATGWIARLEHVRHAEVTFPPIPERKKNEDVEFAGK